MWEKGPGFHMSYAKVTFEGMVIPYLCCDQAGKSMCDLPLHVECTARFWVSSNPLGTSTEWDLQSFLMGSTSYRDGREKLHFSYSEPGFQICIALTVLPDTSKSWRCSLVLTVSPSPPAGGQAELPLSVGSAALVFENKFTITNVLVFRYLQNYHNKISKLLPEIRLNFTTNPSRQCFSFVFQTHSLTGIF